MPNITPEEIADAIAEVLATADGQGVILTDKKFSQSNADLLRLLKSTADDDEFKGWIVTWLAISEQTDEGDCITETIYRFAAKFFHFYADDYKENLSTDMSFKRALFAANEALNAKRHLDFKGAGQPVRHSGLQSDGDFDLEDLGGGAANQIAHTAPFTLDVSVTNQY
jgi:hypothetical protein